MVGGYNNALFINKPELKDKKCTLYLLQIGELYKIGITVSKLKNRIKGIVSKAKTHGDIITPCVLAYKEDTLFNCYNMEQLILKENNNCRIYKKWSTELLSELDIKKYFN